MSTYSNSVGTVELDFKYSFDLRTTPTLYINDFSTYSAAQPGSKYYFKVTRPDGIVRDFPSDLNPDIEGSGGSQILSRYEFVLPLDPLSGKTAQGTYKVEMKYKVDGYSNETIKTKSHFFEYAEINVTHEDDIDEFTPEVFAKDTTASYTLTNYTTNTFSREFKVEAPNVSGFSDVLSLSTGTTSAARKVNLLSDGKYYDTQYKITLDIVLDFTSTINSFVTVRDVIQRIFFIDVYKPPTKEELIDEIDQLKNIVESYDGVNATLYNRTRVQYEEVVTGLEHLKMRLDAGDNDNENNEILQKILNILRNNVPRTHTNDVLSSTELGIYSSGAVNFSALTGVPQFNPFETFIFEKSAASENWVIEHNLGKKPSVTIVDSVDNVVIGGITYNDNNKITIDFDSAKSGKAYLN